MVYPLHETPEELQSNLPASESKPISSDISESVSASRSVDSADAGITRNNKRKRLNKDEEIIFILVRSNTPFFLTKIYIR